MSRQIRFLSVLAVAFISAGAHAQPPRGPEILIDDVTRFYELYATTAGKPTAEQLERDYMAKATPSLVEFAKLRRVTARSIAGRIAKDPAIYEKARACMQVLPDVKTRLAASFKAFADLYPEARFPPVAIVVGHGKPVGTANRNGLYIGLEALCAADFMNPDLEDRFVHVIAHEYGHVQQPGSDFEEGSPNATVLRVSLLEGVAELIAELTSGSVGNPGLTRWTNGKETDIESAFVRDMDSTDLSKWVYNYLPGSAEPYDLGYWVGYRIAKAYYLGSDDPKAALKQLIELEDPKAILEASGWTPGMTLPETR
ncbi:putative Zn-dependent protease DUF2268 [Pseudoxanthomonas sp. 3HH-4]|uniref:DUF2268 domain-containing putative Zn-dependent protease n=1 Tax=Pseudoxanthomonas sp. 3HH-4 TaxID=1690214 RepID=UPI001153546D|nr:DUF2268 domain-containing putative Zn-dependent protease [Pseudoxanthomonas sp. 3HH-4]TQM10354.1 putative Zn-dependent protease DUF2268 [Pseudoxanthomonas sp. 3HH-4]